MRLPAFWGRHPFHRSHALLYCVFTKYPDLGIEDATTSTHDLLQVRSVLAVKSSRSADSASLAMEIILCSLNDATYALFTEKATIVPAIYDSVK